MKTFHPSAVFFYFISIIVFTAFVSDPILLCEAFLGGAVFALFCVPRKEISGDIWFYLPLFLMVAVANPIFSHNGATPLFFLNGNPFTLEAVFCGIGLATSVIGVLLWCRCFSEIMTEDKILCLFGKPFPKLSLVLSSALRFVPELRRQIKKVKAAQKAMGFYSSESFVSRLKSTARVFSAITAWATENAIETADAMKARGLGIKGRTSYSLFTFKKRDAALLITEILLLATAVTGLATGAADFYYYPEITFPEASLILFITRAAFGILSFLPAILEIKEAVVWKFCESKI